VCLIRLLNISPGQYTCRVSFNAGEAQESITIKFTTEGQRKLWITKLQEVVDRHSGGSKDRLTIFSWLDVGTAKPENPYALDEDDDDDDAKGG